MKSNWIVLKNKLKAIKNLDLAKPHTHQGLSKVYLKANSKARRLVDIDQADQNLKKLLKAVDSRNNNSSHNREAAKSKEEEAE